LSRTFVMPSFGVSVKATFRKTQARLNMEAVESARTAIEGGIFRIAQATGNDAAQIRVWLIDLLRILLISPSVEIELRSSSGLSRLTGDVTVVSVVPAIAGSIDIPEGVNGSFRFKVNLSIDAEKAVSGEVSGVIVATPYSAIPLRQIELTPVGELNALIINTGNTASGTLSLSLSGTNADQFTLQSSTVQSLTVGEDAFVSLVPNPELTVGTYRVALTVSGLSSPDISPISIEFVYTVVPVGLDAISSSPETLQAYSLNKRLYIIGLIADEIFSVTDILGRLVYKAPATDTHAEVTIKTSGIYIVKSGYSTVKVIVR